MEILIVGSGYVGLVTGVCFAEMGHRVTCLDIDTKKITKLKNGELFFVEPGLAELLERNIKAKRICFTTEYKEAVLSSDVCFICVPTPCKNDGSCDLSYVLDAARSIAEHMNGYKVIVNKSTVVPGSAEIVEEQIRSSLKKKVTFDLVSNPEFLKEGAAVSDCMKPDRILIGSDSPKAIEIMKELYKGFNVNRDRILVMSRTSAEMSKYAANAMLATRISLMNEMALLCEKVGADINAVRVAIGSDKRIGYDFLYAGAGYGGSCFPKDTRALMAIGDRYGEKMSIIRSVEEVNEKQKQLIGRKIVSYFNKRGGIEDKTIAIWGLSFKPETDDVRESPALILVRQLLFFGAKVKLFNPVSMEKAMEALGSNPDIEWCIDEYAAAENADAVALMTEWKQFHFVDFNRIKKLMRGSAIFDGRNQYNHEELFLMGFDHFGIGIASRSTTYKECQIET